MDLFAEYQRFQASHAVTRRCVEGMSWEYIACGRGAQTLVLLPGALGDASTSFQYITAFEPDYRVLALAYPPALSRVAQVTSGLAALLDAEGVACAHIVGGSLSGMFAQCFVRSHPQRAGKLILSHTGVPSPARLRASELYLRTITRRTLGALRIFARLMNHAAFRDAAPAQRFWHAYFDRVIAAITREELEMRVRLVIDFDRNYAFASQAEVVAASRQPAGVAGNAPATAGSLGYHGPILIVDSESDLYISRAERLALRALYPGARVCSLDGAGHSGTLEYAERYIALYRGFLDE